MIEEILFAVIEYGDGRLGGGDSHSDRLSCCYTVIILILFSLLVTTRQLAGDPISCWCPAEFEDSMVEFTNQACWVKNTYYLPYEKEIPKTDSEKDWIGYYQWVGLLLCFQAVLFYIPRMIWRVFNKKSGISVATVTDAAINCQTIQDSEAREKTIMYMSKHMSRFLHDTSRSLLMSNKCKSCFWILYGNYLCVLYLIMKLVYIANAIGQIFLLDRFLGTKYSMYGFEVIDRLVKGEGLSVSHRFPRVTMCDISIRHLGRANNYTLQCALAVNLFNEKIFIFVWFWLVFVSAFTIGSFLIWSYIFAFLGHHEKYIRARLIALDKMGNHPEHLVSSFIDEFLRRDGIFLIKLVAKNSSDLVAAELISGLWDHFLGFKHTIMRLEKRPSTRGDRITAIQGDCFDDDDDDDDKSVDDNCI